MRCTHCGKPLPLLRKWTGGEFCSEEHRREYAQDQAKLALSRLVDETAAVEAGKRPRRRGIALPLPAGHQSRKEAAVPVALTPAAAALAAPPPSRLRPRALPLPKPVSKAKGPGPEDPSFCHRLYPHVPRPQRDGIRIRLKWDGLFDGSAFAQALPSREVSLIPARIPAPDRLPMRDWIPAKRPGMSLPAACGEPWAEPASALRWPVTALRTEREEALYSQRPVDEIIESGKLPFARLAPVPVNGHYRDWRAPVRLARDSGFEISPAIAPSIGLRIDRGHGTPAQAPLVRGNRLLGRPRMGVKRVVTLDAEPRFPLAQPGVRLRLAGSGVTLVRAGKLRIELACQHASGSRAAALPVEAVFPQAHPAMPDLSPIEALQVLTFAQRVPMDVTSGAKQGAPACGAAAAFEFPAPFLVPPKPPAPAAPEFRAGIEGLLALSVAPKRGVESARIMGPSHGHIEFGAPGLLMPIPPLQPATDWLPMARRAFPLPFEVPGGRLPVQIHRGFPFDEDPAAQPPLRPAAGLDPVMHGLGGAGGHLFRLNYDRIVPHDTRTAPRAALDPFRARAEAAMPKFQLRLRNAFEAEFDEDGDFGGLPLWKRPLAALGAVWSNLHAVPKWGGVAAMAVLFGLFLIPRPQATGNVEAAATAAPTAREGLSSFQRTLLSRAAIALTDDFRAGLADWEGDGDWARSWSYDAAGFVRTGALSLYTPSLGLTDYRLEFLGQIERGGMSWAVRASDLYNYQAVKIELRNEGGPLPAAYVVRYPVIAGKPGEALEKRLPMQVTADMLYRVLMEVRGDHYVLSVGGNIVHSWTERRFPHGGVGFFSAKGELARLRWVGVWHQYDTLGRLCAFLAPYSLSERERSGGQ
jgi:hypothetical protein